MQNQYRQKDKLQRDYNPRLIMSEQEAYDIVVREYILKVGRAKQERVDREKLVQEYRKEHPFLSWYGKGPKPITTPLPKPPDGVIVRALQLGLMKIEG